MSMVKSEIHKGAIMRFFQPNQCVIGMLVFFSLTSPARAYDATPTEIAMLPAYCDAKIGSRNQETGDYWLQQMGRENWTHMHHYCTGLLAMNRYYGQSRYEQGRTLSGAIWDFDYVLKNTQPDFYLRADFHYNRGKALLLQGKEGPAVSDFQKALERSPGMPSASIELADLYKKRGKKDLALTTLKTALERFPTNNGLRRRYQEMGGDLASIPAAPAAVKETQVPAVGSGNSNDVAPAKPDPGAAVVQGKPEVIDQKIGNEANPWCRFCPDPPAPKSEKQ
jgi:tetratricopeptide (TPR) repeat protein